MRVKGGQFMHGLNSDAQVAGAGAAAILESGHLPERCSKTEFAAMLGLHGSAVSRYKAAGRMVFDRAGRVAVRESLARLAATWDPQRGGRKGGGVAAADGGTLRTIQALLAMAPAPGDAGGFRDELARVRAELAAVRAELAEAGKVADWYIAARDSGQVVNMEEVHERTGRLGRMLRESFHEAAAAHAAGGKAWELFMAGLMARTVWAWDEETLREHVAVFFGDDWQPEPEPEEAAG